MKKLALTLAIVLTMGLGAYAQEGSGLFGFGKSYDDDNNRGGELFRGGTPGLPGGGGHGSTDDGDAPLGGGALLLIGFGAAYAMKKKNEK